jgi:hypothetical protein
MVKISALQAEVIKREGDQICKRIPSLFSVELLQVSFVPVLSIHLYPTAFIFTNLKIMDFCYIELIDVQFFKYAIA